MEGTKKQIKKIQDELAELKARQKKFKKMLNNENFKLEHQIVEMILPHFDDLMDLAMILVGYVDFKYCVRQKFLHRSVCYRCKFSLLIDAGVSDTLYLRATGCLKLKDSNKFERIVEPIEDEDKFILEDFINYNNVDEMKFVCRIDVDSPIWQKDVNGLYLPPGMTLTLSNEDDEDILVSE